MSWDRVRRYAEKSERLVVGIMSGTSVDGVDAALVRLSDSGRETHASLVHFLTLPFPADLRAQVLAVNHGEGNAETLSRLNFALGSLFADAAQAVVDAAGISPADVDAVASHGQTVSHTAHRPPPPNPLPHAVGEGGKERDMASDSVSASGFPSPTAWGRGLGGGGATLQIGEASLIAQRLGVPVISDFRTADVALGGQGAPLVPYADWCLLTHPTKTRAIQNIGGIGNVTYLPADAAPEQVIGFDTGPGNMLIDRAVEWFTEGKETFDRDGKIARGGSVWPSLLELLHMQTFLHQPPPKSAGREEFGEAFWQGMLTGLSFPGMLAAAAETTPGDRVVATLTQFTAETIADAYERFLPTMPDEVIIGGGGARNPVLMEKLAKRLAPVPVLTHESMGINSEAKEAIAFALLANETLLGNPSNLPSVTGAARPVLLGKLTLS